MGQEKGGGLSGVSEQSLTKKNRFKAVKRGVFVVFIAIVAWKVLSQDQIFPFQNLNLSVSDKAVAAEIKTQLKPYLGTNLVGLELDSLYRKLKTIPNLKNLKLKKSYPKTLSVWAESYDEVGIEYKEGKLWTVNENGENLRELSPQKKAEEKSDQKVEQKAEIKVEKSSLPLLSGLTKSKDRRSVCKFLSELRHELEKKGSGIKFEDISEVSWASLQGLQIKLEPLSLSIELGFSDFLKNFRRAEKSFRYLAKKSLQPQSIDATYNRRVVVRFASKLKNSSNRLNLK